MYARRNHAAIAFLLILILLLIGTAGCGKNKGTVTLPDGSTYIGELTFDSPNGKGTLTSPTGNKYTGQFHYGQMEGKGTFTWSTGEWYTGEFKNGVPNGKGKLYKMNGQMEMDVVAKDGKLTVVGTPSLHVSANKKSNNTQSKTNTSQKN